MRNLLLQEFLSWDYELALLEILTIHLVRLIEAIVVVVLLLAASLLTILTVVASKIVTLTLMVCLFEV